MHCCRKEAHEHTHVAKFKTPRRASGNVRRYRHDEIDDVFAELRRLGELGDPDHPDYVALKPKAVRCFMRQFRRDTPRAEQLAIDTFNVYRTRSALIPGAPPTK
jgi:hypothetical protein